MKQTIEITDKQTIDDILNKATYGTLALCKDHRPYSLPINFVSFDEVVYFHGSKKGKKIDIIKANSFASFSVVEAYSVVPSYFGSNDGLACPATHFYSSVIIDGDIKFVDDCDEKIAMLTKLMQKLQQEGKYRPLDESIYTKMINATTIYKLVPQSLTAKVKLAQQYTKEKFDNIIKHLEQRGDHKDILTTKLMIQLKHSTKASCGG